MKPIVYGLLAFILVLAMRGAILGESLLVNLQMRELTSKLNTSASSDAAVLPACLSDNAFDPTSEALVTFFKRSATRYGLALWLTGQCNKAIDVWETLYQSVSDSDSPNDIRSTKQTAVYLYQAYFALGEWNKAGYYLRTLNLLREAGARGRKAEAQGDLESAVEWYRIQVKLLPSIEFADQSVRLLTSLNRSSEAGDVWQLLADGYSPTHAEHWLAIAKLAALQQDCSGTEQALKEALSLDQKRVGTFMELALNARGCGAPADAASWYLQAAELDPLNEYIWAHVGIAYYEAGEWEQAREYLTRSLTVKPNPFAYDYLSRLAEQTGDWFEALRWQALLIDMAPSAMAYLRLGDLYMAAGSTSDGQAAYQQSLTLQPQDNPAQERLLKFVPTGQKP